MIALNVGVGLLYLVARDTIAESLPDAPTWAILVLTLGCAANVVFAIALFQWRKWGFSGLAVTSVVGLVVNLAIGLNAVQALLGLVGIGILYGVLQIGGNRNGWTQLA